MDVRVCRFLIRLLCLHLIKRTTTAERGIVWVAQVLRDRWEFHGPQQFYWYGRASNEYEARHRGWNAYFNRNII
jgi:hypothetical protein